MYVSIQWVFRLPSSFLGLFAISVTGVLLATFSSVDAFVSRVRRNAPRPSLLFLLIVVPVALLICQIEVSMLCRAQGLKPFKVPSTSMEPTIGLNESIVTDARYYRDRTPQRGDVIVFRHDGLFIVKRVVAIAGDSIEGTPENIILNGELLPPSLERPDPTFEFPRIVIPAGRLFVVGDNRPVSLDSRVSGYGLVDAKDLVGKALYITRSKTSERIGTKIE